MCPIQWQRHRQSVPPHATGPPGPGIWVCRVGWGRFFSDTRTSRIVNHLSVYGSILSPVTGDDDGSERPRAKKSAYLIVYTTVAGNRTDRTDPITHHLQMERMTSFLVEPDEARDIEKGRLADSSGVADIASGHEKWMEKNNIRDAFTII